MHPFAHGDLLSAYYCVNIMLQPNFGLDRDDVVQKLKKCGIGTSVHYPVALPPQTITPQNTQLKKTTIKTQE